MQLLLRKYIYQLLLVTIVLSACDTRYERQIAIDGKVVAIIYEEGKKQGLKDTLGNILLPARFDYIEDFVECSVIKVDSGGRNYRDDDLVGYETNKLGLIDLRGNIIVEPQYDEISFNWFPLALVKKGGAYGYINNKGVTKIPVKYIDATPFQNGFAVVKTETGYGLIDSVNAFIIEPQHELLELGYATGFPKDTMIVVFDKNKKSMMINQNGDLFDVISK